MSNKTLEDTFVQLNKSLNSTGDLNSGRSKQNQPRQQLDIQENSSDDGICIKLPEIVNANESSGKPQFRRARILSALQTGQTYNNHVVEYSETDVQPNSVSMNKMKSKAGRSIAQAQLSKLQKVIKEQNNKAIAQMINHSNIL